jgi:hypothetical protein
MSDVKRYTPSYDNQMMIEDVGEYVKFEDYEKRVNGQLRLLEVSGRYNEQLEKRIAELEYHKQSLRDALSICVEMAYAVDQYGTIEIERKKELKTINSALYLSDDSVGHEEKSNYLSAINEAK